MSSSFAADESGTASKRNPTASEVDNDVTAFLEEHDRPTDPLPLLRGFELMVGTRIRLSPETIDQNRHAPERELIKHVHDVHSVPDVKEHETLSLIADGIRKADDVTTTWGSTAQ